MKNLKISAVVALLLSIAGISMAGEEAAMDKPAMYTSTTSKITAVVQAINHETREVTVKRTDGEVISFTASPEARNLDQVAVGDIVHAQYTQSMSIRVVANDGAEPEAGAVAALARTEKGEMPGMAAMNAQVVTATVEEINIEANTFKLKGPDGTVNEFTARNPENLKRAEVGDLVIITVTDSVAISVEEGDAE
jgi:hypothetical protein